MRAKTLTSNQRKTALTKAKIKEQRLGSAQISDTERFDGYMANQNKANNESVSQERSQVGSLDGSVNINAGNNYNKK
jgi:filamentous hemagglutinin